ncbi:MAG: hypothetical protein NC548_63505 [Lachnospiraceae bacterium]|nr:hypothetical protein [Lachnospiraceae bacterium]
MAVFSDILTMYINDKNSSSIREFPTVSLAGYTHNAKKIGFNGYRQEALGDTINCEAKPKNIESLAFLEYKEGKRKTKPAKLNGGGNFTDYTWARLKRDSEAKLNMLTSGFVDGRLFFVLEFGFNHPKFIAHLQKQLKAKFPNGDESGFYLRSASFSFSDYKECAINVIFIAPLEILSAHKAYIDKTLFNFLAQKAR